MDETHDPNRLSWVQSANGHADFPIQNLPLGIFCPLDGPRRGGIAIGDEILDLGAALEAGLFSGLAEQAAGAASGRSLNPFFALGAEPRRALRKRLGEILDIENPEAEKLLHSAELLFHRAADCSLELPATIGDYTDFYAGIHHATNTGTMLRPDMPLSANYKYLPIAYHGRASSIRPSGTAIRRPQGQRKRGNETEPSFGPSRNLDYELELGIWLGPGNELGEPIPIDEAANHIAGFCLLNDWSARDFQAWETAPLGPFLAKNFVTSISPWVVTAEALEPFRRVQDLRAEGDPKPMDYLWNDADQQNGALDVTLEAYLSTEAMRTADLPPLLLARSNSRYLYWTPAQLVTHHASAGCNLAPGDLIASGTISGPDETSLGSILELTRGGRRPIPLPSGETRRFLEDGDEVIFHANCTREGYVSIGFGECRGKIVAAAIKPAASG